MDLRGKPSTFSAEGTEKLVVGEDGLDGGSLVVSMVEVEERPAARMHTGGWTLGGVGGSLKRRWMINLITMSRRLMGGRRGGGGGGRGRCRGRGAQRFSGCPVYQSPAGNGSSSSIPESICFFFVLFLSKGRKVSHPQTHAQHLQQPDDALRQARLHRHTPPLSPLLLYWRHTD